jgi:hypothetical protein
MVSKPARIYYRAAGCLYFACEELLPDSTDPSVTLGNIFPRVTNSSLNLRDIFPRAANANLSRHL